MGAMAPSGGGAHAVGGMLQAKADRQPVPGIDGSDPDRERDEFVVGEGAPYFLVVGVGCAALRDPGEGLGPGEGSPFPLRVELGFAPSVEEEQPVLRLAPLDRVLPVHVQAVCAAVHLGHPQLDEVEQLRIEAVCNPGFNGRRSFESGSSDAWSCETPLLISIDKLAFHSIDRNRVSHRSSFCWLDGGIGVDAYCANAAH
jgi:hypothetical protein